MRTKEKILGIIKDGKSITGKELSALLGISRQAVNKHLQEFIRDGTVVKDGTTRGTVYRFPRGGRWRQPVRKIGKTYLLPGLEEDRAYQELALLLNFKKELNECASDIVHYAFTEILNNAIDHSESKKCRVRIGIDQYGFNFIIRDFGIGIFYSIYSKIKLSDENAAVGELVKGKTTTMKEKHSGEGIFFTSKCADIVTIRSHRLNLIFDNRKRDIHVEQRKFISGTEVDFSISRRTKRRLDRIFMQFAPEEFDYRFEKTRVLVRLFHKDYVSRSEAKRMLFGLDKFSEIVLDFRGVKSIGQGFADEIFRVFRSAHPEILVQTENVSPFLESIIKHVVDDKIK